MIFNKNSWKAAYAVWQRNVTIYRRNWKMSLLPNFFEPFLYLLGMGVGLGFYINDSISGISYLAFIAPGLVASAAMNGATFETTYNVFVRMVFERVYNAYLGAPVRPSDIILGELLWAVTRAAIYGIIFLLILVIYHFMGYNLFQSPLVLFAPVVIVLIGVLFAAIGLFFTGFIKSIDYYSYYFTLFLTPLFLFSGIFYPVLRFPYGDTIAWFTPLYHGVRVMRSLMLGTFGASDWVSIAWMACVSGLLFVFIPKLYEKRLAD